MITAELERARSRARSEFVGNEGDYWLQKLETELAKLPLYTVVVINVANGEFVTAGSRLEAMDKFDQRYGENTTFGFVHEIGRPVLIGGGVV
jgi:hypothetical protein